MTLRAGKFWQGVLARLLIPLPGNTHLGPHSHCDSNFFDFLLAAHIRISHMRSLAPRGSLSLTLRSLVPPEDLGERKPRVACVLSTWRPEAISSSERLFCRPLLPEKDSIPLWASVTDLPFSDLGKRVCQATATGRAGCGEQEGPTHTQSVLSSAQVPDEHHCLHLVV